MSKLLFALIPAFFTSSNVLAAGGGGGGTSPPPPIDWSSIIVSGTAGNNHGSHASMAWGQGFCDFGPCQIIGIAFFDANSGDLMYTSSVGGAPFTSPIRVQSQAQANSIVGTHASLAFNGVTPVIAYHRDDFSSLMVARKVTSGGNCGPSGNWQCNPIEGGGFRTTLKIDSLGRMHIAHINNVGELRVIRLASPSSTTLQWQKVVASNVSNVRMDIDEINQPHVIFATQTQVKYSRNLFELGDLKLLKTFAPIAGHGPARIAIAASDGHRAHVVFVTPNASANYEIEYMYQTGDTTWAPRDTVDIILGSTTQSEGITMILDDDNDDLAAIAWGYSNTHNGVPYKRLMVAYPGRHLGLYWNGDVVDVLGGSYPSMIRLFNDKLAIAHYDPFAADLRYSVHN